MSSLLFLDIEIVKLDELGVSQRLHRIVRQMWKLPNGLNLLILYSMEHLIKSYEDQWLRLSQDDLDFIDTIKNDSSQLRFFLSMSLREQQERDNDHDLQYYQFVTNN